MIPPHPRPREMSLRAHLLMGLQHGGHGYTNGALVVWAGALEQLHEEDHEQHQDQLTHGKKEKLP